MDIWRKIEEVGARLVRDVPNAEENPQLASIYIAVGDLLDVVKEMHRENERREDYEREQQERL